MAKFIVAIDLGGTNLKIGLFDRSLRLLRKEVIQTRQVLKQEDLIMTIASSFSVVGVKPKEVLGLGIGIPGPVDYSSGVVHFITNIPGWKDVNLKKKLEKILRLPVFLDNDAKLMTLAESRMGAAKGYSNIICLTLGTGVGGGIVIDNKLYRGKSNAAGEVGHIPLNVLGPGCNCGGNACLETYVGNNRILQEAQKLFGIKVTLEETSELARRKNKKAVELWSKVGLYLGVALAGVVNFMNPDCIIIGGGVSRAGKVLFDNIRKTIKDRAMSVQSKDVKVLPAALGQDSGLIGAALMAAQACNRRKR